MIHHFREIKWPPVISTLAVVVLVAISFLGIWELFAVNLPYGIRAIRLLVVILASLFLGIAIVVSEHLRDTTERERAQLALRDSQERLKRVVEHIGDAFVVDDTAGRVVFANDRFFSLFGFRRSEADSIMLEDYVAPEYRAEARDRYDRQMRGKDGATRDAYLGIRSDGKRLWIEAEVVPLKDRNGRLIGTQKLLRNVTEQNKTKEVLRESEERFRLVANTAPVMIWMSETDRMVSYLNKFWLDFTGRSLDASLGDGWLEGVFKEDLSECITRYTDAFERKESFTRQYRLCRNDGEYRWVLDTGVPRFSADGSFSGYIGSCIDVTEQKHAEEALATIGRRLIEAQEVERAWIARELHDDINQRLALLTVELHRWRQNSSTSPEFQEQLQHVQQSLTEISMDVQGLSHRLHSSKLEYLGLANAAKSFCKEIAETNNVNVDFGQSGISGTLPYDVSLSLFRVLQEALQNGVKHSGSRSFTVELDATPDEIVLTITDAGSGFVEETAFSGKGLGLISMRERMQLVRGDLCVRSTIGRGTTIYARAPLKSNQHQRIAG
jgi:PAS domain S-box-containing protein